MQVIGNMLIDERKVLAERRIDNELKARLYVKHIDPGPQGYYLMMGDAIIAGPRRREDFYSNES